MTTTAQQTVLSDAELACLRDCAKGARDMDPEAVHALVAKGMLQDDGGGHALTPAGHHALHVEQPGVSVPGIDT